MNLTYERFIELVPQETANFVNKVLPQLDRYLASDRSLKFRQTSYEAQSDYSKASLLLFYYLSHSNKYSTFLGQFGFDARRFELELDVLSSQGTISQMFERNSRYFLLYSDESLYQGLKPLDIVIHAFNEYTRQNGSDYLLQELFPKVYNLSLKLVELRDQERAGLEQAIEKEVYEDLPISSISYIETATKIRSLLFQKLKDTDNRFINRTNEDIVPLSLLLSLYYYKNNETSDNSVMIEQTIIQEYLKEKGITLDKINQILGFYIGVRELSEIPKNVYCLKELYAKYFQEGANQDAQKSEVNISKIINNLFDRGFTNSLVIEKLFARLNCYVGMLEPMELVVEKRQEKQKRLYSMEYVKSFYEGLPRETRDFADFTAKTYLLILEKMKEQKHNSRILFDENDADTLALYIATCYYDGDVCNFFEDYGITLEKVLQLLNLSITKEEIEQTELEEKTLVDRFKRFVYEGVNRNRAAKNIHINDIAHNLCNREFNRSMIMENIFASLTNKLDLQSDFLNQLSHHLEIKEQKRKMKITQRLFRDMPAETMEYLENVSRIHQYLKRQKVKFSDSDIHIFSLLLGIMVLPSNPVKDFFQSKGFSNDNICDYLGVSFYQLLSEKIDIDLLSDEYGKYIFSGENKGLERKDLTILNISRNIFSKSISNSVEITRFLGKFHLSYEDFESFSEKYQQYLERTKEARKLNEAKTLLNDYQNTTMSYIQNVIRIHKRIINKVEENQEVKSHFNTVFDIIELSFVLGLFTVNNDIRYFFEKNQLTLENILQLNGLESDIIKDLEKEEIDYLLLLDQYYPFVSSTMYRYNKSVSDIAQQIFSSQFSQNSLILEKTAATLGADYNILKEEVETKKDHELSLTVDDRIQLLTATSVDTLNLDDVKSILHFGNSLSVHSKYIHDELPKLMLGDAHDRSIATINDIIDRVYTKQPVVARKKGFLERLFAISVEEEKPKVVLNSEAVQELKGAIDQNIEALSKELLGYDTIRRYIEVYRGKNRSHFMVASEEVEKMEDLVANLDPHNEEEYAEFLKSTSNLQIMRDKVNRFSTSNYLMKQELLKVNQAIVNHFITINALEMARDDLLPLIGSELALGKGRDTENQALDLSQNVIGLFQSLLTRNVDSAVENIEKLKQSSLPESLLTALNHDIEVYLKGLNQTAVVEQRIESLDMDSEQSALDFKYQPKLELPKEGITGDTSKQAKEFQLKYSSSSDK